MKKINILFFCCFMIVIFTYSCSLDNKEIAETVPTLEGYSWQASKFLGSDSQIDVSSNNWVYVFNNQNGELKENGVVSGDGFTYSISSNQITLTGCDEEHLPLGTYYYWISNNILYFHTSTTVSDGSYPMIEFTN